MTKVNFKRFLAFCVICGTLVTHNFAQGNPIIKENLGDELKKLALTPSETWICSHRGNTYSGKASNIPENSVEAIRQAIAAGADMVEIDVRKTADNRFVLMHDATINRTTTGKGNVSDLTLAQIKSYKLKAASGSTTNCVVPTLEEALLAGKGKVFFDFDLENRVTDAGYLKQLVDLTEETGMLNNVMFYVANDHDMEGVILNANPDALIFAWASATSAIDYWSGNRRTPAFQLHHTSSAAATVIAYARTKQMVCLAHSLNEYGDDAILTNDYSSVEIMRAEQIQIMMTDYTELIRSYLTGHPQQLSVTVQWAAYCGAGDLEGTSPSLSSDNQQAYYANGTEARLYAFDTSNGSPVWNYGLGVVASSNPNRIAASVGNDGIIYVPVGSNASMPACLHAVNPDGTLKWKYAIGAGASLTYITPAISRDGHILVGNNGTNGALHWINKETGESLAYIKPPRGVRGTIAVSQDNIAYAQGGDDGVNAYDLNRINASGEPFFLGNFKVDNTIVYHTISSPAIDKNGNYLATSGTGRIVSLTLNPGLNANWIYPSNTDLEKIEQGGIVIGIDGTIYVNGHENNKIYALHPNGTLKWTFATEGNAESIPAIDNNGYLHFGDRSGNYYIIEDKQIKAEQKYRVRLNKSTICATRMWSSPAIADDGAVYIAATASNGGIYLFCIVVEGVTGPARSEWPMKGANAQRTGLQRADSPSGISVPDSEKLLVFSYGEAIELVAPDDTEVFIYDLFGRLILKRQITKGRHRFPVQKSQLYMVKANAQTRKVLIK
jgi:glycerophosphoryl diester phosphodiesterase/outer membrane protein assembly factor BamB